MALRLRTNGAPLSGALFVSNPRRRKKASTKRRRAATSTRRRAPVRRRKKRNTLAAKRRNARGLRLLANRRNRSAALKRRRNVRKGITLRKRNAAKRSTALALRTNRSTKRRRNAPKRRRNPVAKRRNMAAKRYTKRRNSAIQSLQVGALSKLKNLVGKLPVVGSTAAQFVGPLALGVGAAAVHYYGVKVLQHFAPNVARKVNPIKYTVAGSLVAVLLTKGGNLPGIKNLSADTRKQIAGAALVLGGGLDTFRALTNTMGDLGGIGVDLGGIGVDLGDGGAFDVVPLQSNLDYSGAVLTDAAAAPNDLSVDEGNAALAGPGYWRRRFGPPPRQAWYASMAYQPGHRFGWLIKLIGFDRFQQLAALPPVQRTAYIAELKQQAIVLADNATGAQSGEMAGIGLDMGATMTAGAVI